MCRSRLTVLGFASFTLRTHSSGQGFDPILCVIGLDGLHAIFVQGFDERVILGKDTVFGQINFFEWRDRAPLFLDSRVCGLLERALSFVNVHRGSRRRQVHQVRLRLRAVRGGLLPQRVDMRRQNRGVLKCAGRQLIPRHCC